MAREKKTRRMPIDGQQPSRPKWNGKWVLVIALIVCLSVASIIIIGIFSLLFLGSSLGPASAGSGNVAHIKIQGIITSTTSGGLFSPDTTSSEMIVEQIEDAEKRDAIRAILIEINSQGGSPVASEEITRAVREAEKPTVAWIRDIGTSGAYWVASGADVIVASRLSLIGSIGVIGSYLEFSGLLERYNVSYQRLVSAQYKDTGSPLKKPTVDELSLLQQKIDLLHGLFARSVAENRNLNDEELGRVSDGSFFLGSEGIALKLVDVLGGKKEAITILETELNTTVTLARYVQRRTILDMLTGMVSGQSFAMGRGIGRELISTRDRVMLTT